MDVSPPSPIRDGRNTAGAVVVLLVILAVVGVVVGGILAFLAGRGGASRRATRTFDARRVQTLREDAARSGTRSQAVLRGQIAEHLVPLSAADEWGFDLADARFLGQPIDFIVFDGYTDVRAGRRSRLEEIVFVDVKTGHAALSTVERRIRTCVEAGRVRFLSLHASDVTG
jgi:predicted Holliday junction resolvase-like endonuclease